MSSLKKPRTQEDIQLHTPSTATPNKKPTFSDKISPIASR
jgi:hypothetical protein